MSHKPNLRDPLRFISTRSARRLPCQACSLSILISSFVLRLRLQLPMVKITDGDSACVAFTMIRGRPSAMRANSRRTLSAHSSSLSTIKHARLRQRVDLRQLSPLLRSRRFRSLVATRFLSAFHAFKLISTFSCQSYYI